MFALHEQYGPTHVALVPLFDGPPVVLYPVAQLAEKLHALPLVLDVQLCAPVAFMHETHVNTVHKLLTVFAVGSLLQLGVAQVATYAALEQVVEHAVAGVAL